MTNETAQTWRRARLIAAALYLAWRAGGAV